jgi:hypothetical protein
VTAIDPRLDELLAGQMLGDLSPEEETELTALLAEHPLALTQCAGLEAALALATWSASPADDLPAHLRARLADDAETFLRANHPAKTAAPAKAAANDVASTSEIANDAPARPSQATPVASPPAGRSSTLGIVAFSGWLAAAALALVALRTPPASPDTPPSATSVASLTPPTPPAPVVKTLSERRAELLAKGNPARRIDWAATADPAAAGVSGDVVWDGATGAGYMRFRGLAVNDPTKLQYQLWIFDKEQDAKHPVDGGVFDIDTATGDVIVAITPKLAIHEAQLFAITIEKPGGVVVSSRKRLVLAAKVPAG